MNHLAGFVESEARPGLVGEIQMKKQLLLASAAVVALGASSASASDHDGWYLSIGAGANWVASTEPSTRLGDTLDTSFDAGWALHGSVGYDFDAPVRLEVEFAHRDNDIEEIFESPNGGLPILHSNVIGELTQSSAMLNLLFDVSIGETVDLTLGGGVGLARADLEARSGPILITDSDSDELSFAYQGIAGLGFDLGDQTQLFVEYRYFANHGQNVVTFPPPNLPLTDEADFDNHTASVGLRFFFDEPEAPMEAAPPPAPPPAPMTSFNVYFDFNKSNLTAEGQAAVAEAVEARKSSDGPITIEIQGDGDASMDAQLADRRAAAVKAAAVDLGAPADSVSVETRDGGDATVTLN